MSNNETVEHGSNIIISVIFVAIFLAVMLLALVVVVGAIITANQNLNGKLLTSGSAINETGYINNSGYTLYQSYNYPTAFTPTITSIVNASNGYLISSGNYTLTGRILTNKTATTWSNVSISYTFTYDDTTNDTVSSSTMNSINNGVIGMVVNFFALMPVVGTIFAVVILIGGIVLLVIYVRRMKGEENTSGAYYG